MSRKCTTSRRNSRQLPATAAKFRGDSWQLRGDAAIANAAAAPLFTSYPRLASDASASLLASSQRSSVAATCLSTAARDLISAPAELPFDRGEDSAASISSLRRSRLLSS